jgi:MFS family permease
MTSQLNRKISAFALAAALLVPAASAFANDWTKPMSRTRGATIGGAVGALAGPPGVVAGAAVGNGVQSVRHHMATHHRRHHHRRY